MSVVVPTYNSGERIMDVIDSLDAQSLPSDEFEAIFIDDGSTDGTYDLLSNLAITRPYMRVKRIANTGWPGRPRNLGTEMARGDYVLYMDHDDKIFPEALERVHRYGIENNADVVIGKEVIEGAPTLAWDTFREDVPRATAVQSRVLGLMTPHKFYRREFLTEHGILYPEEKCYLEDHFFNIPIFVRAKVISVLADYPCYTWVKHATNNSKAYQAPDYFWRWVRQAIALIHDHTSPGDVRDVMMARWYGTRILRVFSPRMLNRPRAWIEAGMPLATQIVETYIDKQVDERMSHVWRLRSTLLRRGDLDGLYALAKHDKEITATTRVTDLRWDNGAILISGITALTDRSGTPYPLRREGDRVLRQLPADLTGRFTPADLDVTGALTDAVIELGIRGRRAGVEWPVATDGAVAFLERDGGTVAEANWRARVDPRTAAFGRPLDENLWDLSVRLSALGFAPHRRLPVLDHHAHPALLDGRPAVVYATVNDNVSLDLAEENVGVVQAAEPRIADLTIADNPTGGELVLRLPALHVHGNPKVGVDVSVAGQTTPGELTVEDGCAVLRASYVAPAASAPIMAAVTGGGKPTGLALLRQPDGRSVPTRLGDVRPRPVVSELRWDGGMLRATIDCPFVDPTGNPYVFEHVNGEVLLDAAAAPPAAPASDRAVTPALVGMELLVNKRGSDDWFTVPVQATPTITRAGHGRAHLTHRYDASLDPATMRAGKGLKSGLYDVYTRSTVFAGGQPQRLGQDDTPAVPGVGLPAVYGGGTAYAIAYGTVDNGKLSIAVNRTWPKHVLTAAATATAEITMGHGARLRVALPLHLGSTSGPLRGTLRLSDGQGFEAAVPAAVEASTRGAELTARLGGETLPAGRVELSFDVKLGRHLMSMPLGRWTPGDATGTATAGSTRSPVATVLRLLRRP
ncbi:hypothetical protein GCM10009681_55070 [Luedemannella helvata]|uniref:Glycosyltransferase n=2 Tax=Luedemannella helvata TaxID=349315 RepID=A0ABN2L686_9ACTN